MLVLFARRRVKQVCRRLFPIAAANERVIRRKLHFRVAMLVEGKFVKEIGDLVKALFSRNFGEKVVFIPRLRFARERLEKVRSRYVFIDRDHFRAATGERPAANFLNFDLVSALATAVSLVLLHFSAFF
jgi:hypothetical protein